VRRKLRLRQVPEGERQIAEEARQIERALLPFVEMLHRRGEPLHRARAQLFGHAREIDEQAPLRIEPLAKPLEEGERLQADLEIAAHGVAHLDPVRALVLLQRALPLALAVALAAAVTRTLRALALRTTAVLRARRTAFRGGRCTRLRTCTRT
jgi:hypothetical protein